MKDEQVRIRFQWQPKQTTRDGILAKYLKTSPLLSEKEQIIQTTRMCWLPIALWENKGCDQATLERLARRSIHELQQQIERIARTANLTNDLNFSQSLLSLDEEEEEFSQTFDDEKKHGICDFEVT